MLAADPVHDLQRALAGPAAGGAGHEGDELLGLVRAGADVERLDRQARVADPGVAVVPVALAADGLGQRRGGRRDDRAGRPVGESLEHPRAEAHEILVRALVDVVLGLPGAPGLDRVLDPLGDLVGPGVGSGGSATLRPAPSAARTRPARPRQTRERGAHGRVVDLDAARPARTAIRFGPPKVRPPPSSCRNSGRTRPYSGRGASSSSSSTVARDALDAAQHLVRSVEAEVVAALALGEGHRVEQAHVPVSVVKVVSITSVPGR